MIDRTLPIQCIRLQQLRKTFNLTQEQVSQRLGIKRNTLSCYELGERNIPLDKLRGLAKIYHTSIDYICDLNNHHILVLDDLDPETVEQILYLVSKSYKKNRYD